jgi:hypothetical protein
VNEPLDVLSANHDPASFFYQTLGESYLDIAFNAAAAADPSALLFLNETLVEFLPAKLAGLVTIVQGMISRGVPIHGVGIQGHFVVPPNITQLRIDIETRRWCMNPAAARKSAPPHELATAWRRTLACQVRTSDSECCTRSALQLSAIRDDEPGAGHR